MIAAATAALDEDEVGGESEGDDRSSGSGSDGTSCSDADGEGASLAGRSQRKRRAVDDDGHASDAVVRELMQLPHAVPAGTLPRLSTAGLVRACAEVYMGTRPFDVRLVALLFRAVLVARAMPIDRGGRRKDTTMADYAARVRRLLAELPGDLPLPVMQALAVGEVRVVEQVVMRVAERIEAAAEFLDRGACVRACSRASTCACVCMLITRWLNVYVWPCIAVCTCSCVYVSGNAVVACMGACVSAVTSCAFAFVFFAVFMWNFSWCLFGCLTFAV